MYIKNCAKSVRNSQARLRENRTHNRRGPTDKPLSPAARLAFERDLVESPKLAAKYRARLTELEAQLAAPAALIRVATGCTRVAAGA